MTTYHGLVRTKERTHYKGRRVNKYIEEAFANGKISAECTGKLKKYLEDKQTEKTMGIVYEGYCFIFGINCGLITMYKIPTQFLHKTVYVGKEEIRNCKKYQSLNKDLLYRSQYKDLYEEVM